MSPAKPIGIGIDLGTTYSCVGAWRNGRVEIIPNDHGNRTTPSYVSFSDAGRLIGDAAQSHFSSDPQNMLYGVKRLVGRQFDDVEVQADIRRLPFRVFDKAGKPHIHVEYGGATKELSPEEVSSMILSKMKENAEAHLGGAVDCAVISVPAHFNQSQRQATMKAGEMAGFRELRVINEPSAAAIAYSLEKGVRDERNVLIFDLGGGTLDVSLVTIEDGIIEVKATAGDGHLGGVDFDNRLVDHFIREFYSKHQKDLSSSPRAVRRLRTVCERAKRALSSATQASLEIDTLLDSIDFYTSLTREKFEELCSDLFNRALEPVKKVIHDSRVKKDDVCKVIFVGGATRMPRIATLVSSFFGYNPDDSVPLANQSINPDEAVAYGTAIQAAMLCGDDSEKIQDLLLLDVTPLSLGITTEGTSTTIIKHNSGIPTKRSESVYTSDNLINIFEGEHLHHGSNHSFGEINLSGLPPGLRTIEVTFDIDVNGVVAISACDKATGETGGITVTMNKDHLTRDDENGRVNQESEGENDGSATLCSISEDDSESHEPRDTPTDTRLTSQPELDSSVEALKREYDSNPKGLEGVAGPSTHRSPEPTPVSASTSALVPAPAPAALHHTTDSSAQFNALQNDIRELRTRVDHLTNHLMHSMHQVNTLERERDKAELTMYRTIYEPHLAMRCHGCYRCQPHTHDQDHYQDHYQDQDQDHGHGRGYKHKYDRGREHDRELGRRRSASRPSSAEPATKRQKSHYDYGCGQSRDPVEQDSNMLLEYP
ncbi:hypothetical protein AX16_004062 [Volvariella volvacea WC 439]|nr:hypothetical protein AX16_004062 [Volvariella volvacea WC 439]